MVSLYFHCLCCFWGGLLAPPINPPRFTSGSPIPRPPLFVGLPEMLRDSPTTPHTHTNPTHPKCPDRTSIIN